MPPLQDLAPTVRRALVAVAGFELAGAGDSLGEEPLGDRDWASLVRAVGRERLLVLLDRAVAAGTVPATAAQAAAIEDAATQPLFNVLALERRLISVAGHLADAGVPFLVLKGPAVARLDEADPSVRSYADLDLLVKAADLAPALGALGRLGYARDLPERRPGFDRHFGKEISLADTVRSEIDLHRTLALGPFGLSLDLDALWASTDAFALAGTDLRALDAEGRFVHACITAAVGDEHPRLVALRDMAVIAARHDLRADRLVRLAPPGKGAAVIATAVAVCRQTLGVEIGGAPGELAALPPSRWERVALRAYRARGGSNTLELLAGTLGVTGGDRLRYLGALLVPGGTYRHARRRAGRPPELTTGLREMLGRRVKAGRAAPPERRQVPPPAPVWQRKEGVADAELDGERVVWDPETGHLVRLDAVGSLVWAHLDGETTVDQLSADLAHAFDTPLGMVRNDVDVLLQQLSSAGLVVEKECETP